MIEWLAFGTAFVGLGTAVVTLWAVLGTRSEIQKVHIIINSRTDKLEADLKAAVELIQRYRDAAK